MTIKQYADNRKITRQSVYKTISKAGKKTTDFVDSSGNLTNEGLSMLNELFESKSSKPSKDNLQTKIDEQTTIIVDLRKQVETLSKQNEVLTETVDRLSRTLEVQTENLNIAEKLHGRDVIKIEQGQQHKPFFKRLFGKKQED